jgi:hypothetical protein
VSAYLWDGFVMKSLHLRWAFHTMTEAKKSSGHRTHMREFRSLTITRDWIQI